MVCAVHPDSLRQLIVSCRTSSRRFLGFPRDWCPHKILNPTLPEGFYFSDESAWDYIACCLESGHSYTVLELKNPAGALAIQMTVTLPGNGQPLYMKVQIGASNKAIGRSFHLSERY